MCPQVISLLCNIVKCHPSILSSFTSGVHWCSCPNRGTQTSPTQLHQLFQMKVKSPEGRSLSSLSWVLLLVVHAHSAIPRRFPENILISNPNNLHWLLSMWGRSGCSLRPYLIPTHNFQHRWGQEGRSTASFHFTFSFLITTTTSTTSPSLVNRKGWFSSGNLCPRLVCLPAESICCQITLSTNQHWIDAQWRSCRGSCSRDHGALHGSMFTLAEHFSL